MEIISNLTLADCEFLPNIYYIMFDWIEKKIRMFMEYFADAVTLLKLVRLDEFGHGLMKNSIYRLQLFTRFCTVEIISILLRMRKTCIVHGDLHGYNIMINVTREKLQLKVIDFGESFQSNDEKEFEKVFKEGLASIKRFYRLAKMKMKAISPEAAEKDIFVLPEKMLNENEFEILRKDLLPDSEREIVHKIFAPILGSMILRYNKSGESKQELPGQSRTTIGVEDLSSDLADIDLA